NRVGLDGRPRELHVEQALQNIRYDVTDDMIRQPAQRIDGALTTLTRTASCARFVMDMVHLDAGCSQAIPPGQMRVWMILAGSGHLSRDAYRCRFRKGDVLLIPADSDQTDLELESDCEWLEVTIPVRAGQQFAAEQ
ncbi:MAG: hypothetical protein ACYTFZ_10690, partial [Planctomycetota bacterium]